MYATTTRCFIVVIILVVEAGCGTLLTPPVKQSIRVASNVYSADVFLNGEPVGKTPVTVRVSHRQSHTITVRYGDQLESCFLKSRTNWLPLIGDILLIPIGALYSYAIIVGSAFPGEGEDPSGFHVLAPVLIPLAILPIEALTGQLRYVKRQPCLVDFRQP